MGKKLNKRKEKARTNLIRTPDYDLDFLSSKFYSFFAQYAHERKMTKEGKEIDKIYANNDKVVKKLEDMLLVFDNINSW